MIRVAATGAQAKINVGLRILARRPDGFHALETLFHRLELADQVTIRRTEGERALACTGPALPAGGLGPSRDNLAWRAAESFAQAAGWRGGFAIELVKHIPTGGGLGGGSADAGAVLRACQHLADPPLPAPVIAELAAALGSDVPFLAGEPAAALGRGRGERLDPVDPLPVRDVALIFPAFGVSTKDAYSWLADSRPHGFTPPGPIRSADVAGWSELAAHATNDFEPIVGLRHPEIPVLVHALKAAGATLAMLSGSGSTVFGVFEPAAAAQARTTLRDLPGGARITWTRTAARVVPVVAAG